MSTECLKCSFCIDLPPPALSGEELSMAQETLQPRHPREVGRIALDTTSSVISHSPSYMAGGKEFTIIAARITPIDITRSKRR